MILSLCALFPANRPAQLDHFKQRTAASTNR